MKKGKEKYWLDCRVGRVGGNFRTWYRRNRYFSANSDKEAIEKAKDIIRRKALRLKKSSHKVLYGGLGRIIRSTPKSITADIIWTTRFWDDP